MLDDLDLFSRCNATFETTLVLIVKCVWNRAFETNSFHISSDVFQNQPLEQIDRERKNMQRHLCCHSIHFAWLCILHGCPLTAFSNWVLFIATCKIMICLAIIAILRYPWEHHSSNFFIWLVSSSVRQSCHPWDCLVRTWHRACQSMSNVWQRCQDALLWLETWMFWQMHAFFLGQWAKRHGLPSESMWIYLHFVPEVNFASPWQNWTFVKMKKISTGTP